MFNDLGGQIHRLDLFGMSAYTGFTKILAILLL